MTLHTGERGERLFATSDPDVIATLFAVDAAFTATKPKHHAKLAKSIRTAAARLAEDYAQVRIRQGASAKDLIATHRRMKRVSQILLSALAIAPNYRPNRPNAAKTSEAL